MKNKILQFAPIVSIFLSISFEITFAQTAEGTWKNNLGGEKNDQFTSVTAVGIAFMASAKRWTAFLQLVVPINLFQAIGTKLLEKAAPMPLL